MNSIKNTTLLALVSTLLLLSGCSSTKDNNRPIQASSSHSTSTPAGYYRVKPGDNLYRISLKYNTTVAVLSRLNNISDASQIEVGQLIKVPTGQKTTNTKAKPTSPKKAQIKPSSNSAALTNMNFAWPIKGKINKPFNGQTNKGIDISSAPLTPIKSSQAGKVIYNDFVEGYGNVILISHKADNSILTAYGFTHDVLVKNNQQIKKGQIIGTVGKNDLNESVLHFEIRSNGVAVNPMDYLP